LVPATLFARFSFESFPLDKVFAGHFNDSFDVQDWFEKHHCFMADIIIDGEKPAKIITRWCRYYDCDSRLVLCRMQTEYSILTAKLDGKYYVFGYERKKQKRLWREVQREICGFGIDRSFKNWRKNACFRNQVRGCARLSKEFWKKYKYTPFVLFYYDDKPGGVEMFLSVWQELFGGIEN
jgi:hypothetical protein